MSKFILAFTKEKKQNFVQNGDKTRYIEISGCPIESVNGTYYQMDPITINDKTYNLCFTNGVYLLQTIGLYTVSDKYLYELDNSLLIQKFNSIFVVGKESTSWYDSKTLKFIPEMYTIYFGDWQRGYDAQ